MTKPTQQKLRLLKAIEILGGASKLARAAEVSPQVINNAVRRGSVSPELALAIEQATKGEVAKESLVWGDEKKAA
jgi:DNA-binding transcriptional regulator YdaS (Cro superfamily)